VTTDRGRRSSLLAVLGGGIVFNPLNSTTMAVAVIDLQRSFGIDFRHASLTISVYYVVSMVGAPISGRLADRFGRRRLFISGLALLVVASAASAAAPTFGLLLVARAAQALGSSTLYPAALGIVRDAMPERRRQTQALGVLTVCSAVSAAVGPTVGGVLTSGFGWPAVFAVNVPIGLAVLAGAWSVLPADVRATERSQGPSSWIDKLDVAGAGLFFLAVAALVWFLVTVTARPAWWALAVGIACSAMFVRRELTVPDPVIDVRALSGNRALVAVYAQWVLVNVLYYTVIFGIPSFLQEVRGFGAAAAGLAMLPLSGVGALTAPVAARVVGRIGVRRPLILAAGLLIGASLLLLVVGRDGSLAVVLVVLAVFGVANGFNNIGLQVALYAAASAEETSAAAGLFQTSRYLGTILSTSLLGIAFGHSISAAHLHAVAAAMAVIATVILALSCRQPRTRRLPRRSVAPTSRASHEAQRSWPDDSQEH
jgi:MFS family permease